MNRKKVSWTLICLFGGWKTVSTYSPNGDRWSTYLAGGSNRVAKYYIDINMSRVKLDHFPKVETNIKTNHHLLMIENQQKNTSPSTNPRSISCRCHQPKALPLQYGAARRPWWQGARQSAAIGQQQTQQMWDLGWLIEGGPLGSSCKWSYITPYKWPRING